MSNAVVFIDEDSPSLSNADTIQELKDSGQKENATLVVKPPVGQSSAQDSDQTLKPIVEVFFINRSTIPNFSEKNATDLCRVITERFQDNNLNIELFEHVYVCCHFGGGGYYDIYQKTVLLNSELVSSQCIGKQKWAFLAFSKTLIKENVVECQNLTSWSIWLIKADHKFQTLKKKKLIDNIRGSIEFANQTCREISQKVTNVAVIIDQLNAFRVSTCDISNTDGCVVVIGCACARDQLGELRKVLAVKCGKATVFICSKEGVLDSTWGGWNGEFLASKCISRFRQCKIGAKIKIFALSTIPYDGDITTDHALFTDWMFAGWIDCFGKENVRFYGKDANSVRSMMDDLYSGEFRSGHELEAADCHLEDWYKYLMLRMKH